MTDVAAWVGEDAGAADVVVLMGVQVAVDPERGLPGLDEFVEI